MIKILSSIMLCLMGSAQIAMADYIGFASGSEFQAIPVEGTVLMACEDAIKGKMIATYNCRDVVLDPASSDYFMGPNRTDLVQITLTATHEDGTVRTKVAAYDGFAGRSSAPVNLWISTLFQKPLLMKGTNRIQYSFSTGRRSEEHDESHGLAGGEVLVNVKNGKARHCPTTQYTSTDMNVCSAQYSICQRYFENFNECR